jgi:hypothetical protein
VHVAQRPGQLDRRQAVDPRAAGADADRVQRAVRQLQQQRRRAEADLRRYADSCRDRVGDRVADQLAGEQLGGDERDREEDREQQQPAQDRDQQQRQSTFWLRGADSCTPVRRARRRA